MIGMRRTLPTLAALLLLAGCATSVTPDSRHRTPTPHHSPTPVPSSSVLPSGIIIAQGHGWDAHGLFGPMPAPGTCHLRKAADGEPLPDPRCTPGAVDLAVTDVNISTTVCRKGGYTASVRPPVTLTDPAKLQLMAAYGLAGQNPADYELDHLVALNDGGASDLRNLFPEPNNDLHRYPRSTYVHNDKDEVESTTFTAICKGQVTVTAVQGLMATDWTQAMARFGLTPGPASSTGEND